MIAREALEIAGGSDSLTKNQQLGLRLISTIVQETGLNLPSVSPASPLVLVDGQLLYKGVPTEGDLIEIQVDAYKAKGFDINPPKPHKSLRETLLIASDLGWPYAGNFVPSMKGFDIRRLDVPPEEWYFQQREAGNIKTAAKGGYWVAIDLTPRPDYNSGTQIYPNDHLGSMLARLRDGKNINVSGYEHVPVISRFAVSFDEIEQSVSPEVARYLRVDRRKTRVPYEEEFNTLGNVFYPFFGQASAAEWLMNIFEGGRRLYGGYSGYGGLADVSHWRSFGHDDGIGFRLLVEIPSSA